MNKTRKASNLVNVFQFDETTDLIKIVSAAGEERMQFTDSGNLLLGHTTDAGYRFDVNGTARIQSALTLSSLGEGFMRTNASGVVTSAAVSTTDIPEGTNLYFTNARAAGAIALTTTGSSGAATYNQLTGELNIPQYAGGGVWGSITGTMTNQTDLNNRFTGIDSSLVAKLDAEKMDDYITAAQILGSNFKAQTVGLTLPNCSTTTALTTGIVRFVAIYIPKQVSLSGVSFFSKVAGTFTGSNDNMVALFSHSGGTLTRVAESANDENIWKVTANTFAKIPWTGGGTYSAAPGLYFVALVFNGSGTGPSILFGNNMSSANVNNECKISATYTSTTMPTSITLASLTNSQPINWMAVY